MFRRQQNGEGWLAHALREAPWRTQTRVTSLVLILVAVLVVMGMLYMSQASRTATAGWQVQELEAQRDILLQENDYTRAEIASLRSIPRLIAEAEKLGYVEADPDDIKYIFLEGIPEPAPFNPADELVMDEFNEALLAGSEPPLYDLDETLGSWIADRLTEFGRGLGGFFSDAFLLRELEADE